MTCETDFDGNFEDPRKDSACYNFMTEWLEYFPIWKKKHEYKLQDLFILFGLINRVAVAIDETSDPIEQLELSQLMLKLVRDVNDWASARHFLLSEIVRLAAEKRDFEVSR